MNRAFTWPRLLGNSSGSIAYGGDYNPGQWPESVWPEDIRLMQQAGINVAALGIFSWDRIQPADDEWDFGWLDRIIAMLGRADISVDLVLATASAPLWLHENIRRCCRATSSSTPSMLGLASRGARQVPYSASTRWNCATSSQNGMATIRR